MFSKYMIPRTCSLRSVNLLCILENRVPRKQVLGWVGAYAALQTTVETQWLEPLWDHGNLFEIWVVRATEG